MSLYRKYRPKKFSEVIGQDHVVKTLSESIKIGNVNHAYLFTGPRGTGKTTVARILGKAVNCQKVSDERKAKSFSKINTFEPCLKCENCVRIRKNKTLDIIEIDAASNRGIDEIRNVKEIVKVSPNDLFTRIFIIDEVHMLTKEAFNALLKTLEEPPAHTKFILCTTEAYKVPITILSRVMRFDFYPVAFDILKNYLLKLSEKENITIDDESLSIILYKIKGCVRDAISLLDQLSIASEKKITKNITEKILGFGDYKDILKLSFAVLEKNQHEAFSIISEIKRRNTAHPEIILDEMISVFESFLYVKNRIENESSILSKRFLKENKCSIEKFPENDIVSVIQKIIEIKRMLPELPDQFLALEMAALSSEKEEERSERSQKLTDDPGNDETNLLSEKDDAEKNAKEDNNGNKELRESFQTKMKPEESFSLDDIQKKWPEFIEKLDAHNHGLASVYKNSKISGISENRIVINAANEFLKDRCNDTKNTKLAEDVFSEILGKKVSIKCDVGAKKEKTMQEKIKEVFGEKVRV